MSNQRRHLFLVALDVDHDKYTYLTLACGSLLAAVHQYSNVDTTYLSPPSEEIRKHYAEKHAHDIQKQLDGKSPKSTDIAIGVYVWNDALVRRIISTLRDNGVSNRIILGGPQITFTSPGMLESSYPGADVFIRGEGEEVLAKVVSTEQSVAVQGVHYKGDADDGFFAVPNLSALPSPFLGTSDPIPIERSNIVRWETKRGCPYRCWFCQHSGPQNRIRYFDRKRVFSEINFFLSSKIRLLTIIDPVFHIGEAYLDIMNLLRQRAYSGKISMQCHFGCIDEEFLQAVRHLDVCLEFGLQTIHSEEGAAIGRKTDIDEVTRTMHRLSEYGIHYEVDLIYGLPAQTMKSFKKSVDFCEKHNVPVVRTWPLVLLRGTVLDSKEQRERWHFMEDSAAIPHVVSSSTFDKDDWRAMKAFSKSLNKQYHQVHEQWLRG